MKFLLNIKKRTKLVIAIIVIIIVLGAVMLFIASNANTDNRQVITVSTLEKIIDVSELSTFSSVYNGIAQVQNEKKPEKIDFYVSYNAKVNAGIDFKDIKIKIDDEAKVIYVTIPSVSITDVIVDIESMEYMFVNNKADTPTVSERAYKACEADVEAEASAEDQILENAYKSAVNTIKALMQPIVNQLDESYTLEVE